MLKINLFEICSLKNIIPVTDEKIIVPPVINGYKIVAGKFFAPLNCRIYDSPLRSVESTIKNTPHAKLLLLHLSAFLSFLPIFTIIYAIAAIMNFAIPVAITNSVSVMQIPIQTRKTYDHQR